MEIQNFINVVIPPLPGSFTYEIPSSLSQGIDIGHQVEVPLGKRKVLGYVLEKPYSADSKTLPFHTKAVSAHRLHYPFFLSHQLVFFQWIADYYGETLSTVLDTAIPPFVTPKFEKKISLIKAPELSLKSNIAQRIVTLLQESPEPQDYSLILRRIKGAGGMIKKLEQSGILHIQEKELIEHHLQNTDSPSWALTQVSLTSIQQNILDKITPSLKDQLFKTYLVHGVTGSGKTEIYIELVRIAKEAGLGSLVIVPEIALTPQLLDRFKARLGADLAVLHSGLHKRSRWDAWRALIERRSSCAIGVRSAIFAPVHQLGLIIVDEEHEGSYKQEEGLRYNARDLAILRGKQENTVVVLGSATPSLESFYNAFKKKYHYLTLPSRPQTQSQVSLQVVDLNLIKPSNMPSPNISPDLWLALKQNLAKGDQAFILYNRRGFASYLQCNKCESVLQCPHCSVTLTYHRSNHSLLCHYCNLSVTPSEFCPHCIKKEALPANKDQPPFTPGRLQHRGAGTEKVFEEIQQLFPQAQIERLDRDIVRNSDSYRQILDKVRVGETNILVGTQMIAKGHDLPGVTLVGVVDCDVGLHMPDFRAGERAFQLLTQASGRAGRREKPGLIILQTRVPKHPSITHTVSKDYIGFAQKELRSRELLHYPPFSRLLRILITSNDKKHLKSKVDEISQEILNVVQSKNLLLEIIGPSPCPLSRLKTEWRWHILAKAKDPKHLHICMKYLKETKVDKRNNKVRVIFDMDPQDMM